MHFVRFGLVWVWGVRLGFTASVEGLLLGCLGFVVLLLCWFVGTVSVLLCVSFGLAFYLGFVFCSLVLRSWAFSFL